MHIRSIVRLACGSNTISKGPMDFETNFDNLACAVGTESVTCASGLSMNTNCMTNLQGDADSSDKVAVVAGLGSRQFASTSLQGASNCCSNILQKTAAFVL